MKEGEEGVGRGRRGGEGEDEEGKEVRPGPGRCTSGEDAMTIPLS